MMRLKSRVDLLLVSLCQKKPSICPAYTKRGRSSFPFRVKENSRSLIASPRSYTRTDSPSHARQPQRRIVFADPDVMLIPLFLYTQSSHESIRCARLEPGLFVSLAQEAEDPLDGEAIIGVKPLQSCSATQSQHSKPTQDCQPDSGFLREHHL